jgi:hypothetical protein
VPDRVRWAQVPLTPSSAKAGHQAAPEELSWDRPVGLHAESRAPRDDEPAKGFLLRLHTDPQCQARLSPATALLARRYEQVKAEALCQECASSLIPSSSSSVIRRLRDAERSLQRMRGRSDPMPREVVQCRALRFEAESAVSVHPDTPALAARVADLATEISDALREAMQSYDRRR